MKVLSTFGWQCLATIFRQRKIFSADVAADRPAAGNGSTFFLIFAIHNKAICVFSVFNLAKIGDRNCPQGLKSVSVSHGQRPQEAHTRQQTLGLTRNMKDH